MLNKVTILTARILILVHWWKNQIVKILRKDIGIIKKKKSKLNNFKNGEKKLDSKKELKI